VQSPDKLMIKALAQWPLYSCL